MVSNYSRGSTRISPGASVLVYINSLVDNTSSDDKLFADDTSLFTVVYDENIATEHLNRDSIIIAQWAYQWKVQFNLT